MEVGEHTELSLGIFDGAAYVYAMECHEKGERLDWAHLRALLGRQTSLAMPDERSKLLREAEDKANEFVMQGDALLEAVVYKLLYARGLRIGNIEAEIRRALDHKVGVR